MADESNENKKEVKDDEQEVSLAFDILFLSTRTP